MDEIIAADIIVYERDLDRLAAWGIKHNCGDSATALRKLLDDAEERDAKGSAIIP